ncbi:MAG: protein translocase subunit SecD [Planctomycetota bacterium]|nr:protein translocase subunit SecD [Planctomycetota bacterium]
MLENARRQTILVLITLIAALFCCVSFKPLFGPDLKGGNQLVYEVPEVVLRKLESAGLKPATVMGQTISVISQRIDPTGVLDALVSQRGRNGVLIELPWAEKDQLDIIKDRIRSLGKLEMRVVATEDFQQDNVQFDLTQEKKRLQTWLDTGGRDLVRTDWKNIERFNDDVQNGPLQRGNLRWYPHLIQPRLDSPGTWDHPFSLDTQAQDGISPIGPATVTVYDQATEWNSGKIPDALAEKAKQSKDVKPFLLELVAINTKERFFRGEDLDPSKVAPSFSSDGKLAVSYSLKPELHSAYGEWSQKYIKKHSAIILNGVIRSAPYFVTRIPGNGQISGGFTQAEVEELVKVLRTGSLQVEPQLLSDRTTGPRLGEHSLFLGGVSLLAGMSAVFLFMLWYYRIAGLVACFTLLLQMILTWSAILFMQATITLPGLGGIVLTMGMAVDANVLIYERIREESERGKDMLRSVRAGFDRAMSAILDSNITTFLTGLVLYSVGFGPVRGFAVTLMVGIVTTVFTQFFVTRLCFHWLLTTKYLREFKVRRLFAQPKWDYLSKAKPVFIGSMLFIVIGLGITFVIPTEISMGIDFKGGANLQMLLQEPSTTKAVREKLEADPQFVADFRNFSVNTIDAGIGNVAQTFNVRLKLTDKMRKDIDQAREASRLAKQAADEKGETPNAPFEPPYLTHLKRIFSKELAKPAFDGQRVDPAPNNEPSFAAINLHFQSPIDVTAASMQLANAKLPGATVKVLGGAEGATQGTDVLVEWRTAENTRDWQLFDRVRTDFGKLNGVDGQTIRLSNPFPEAEEIQGRMVGELRTAAIGALVLSWALIIFYLRVRFHEYKYGIAAVAALVHDVLVAHIGVVICNYLGLVHAEISLNMVACYLTIIGYSVNDTIVIFDRIRENQLEENKLGGKLSMREIINLSVNQTMSRTILTSGVTFFVVVAQFLVNYGQDSDLESFAFGMILGMISGTYSTIFIASPIIVWINNRYGKRPATTRATEAVARA